MGFLLENVYLCGYVYANCFFMKEVTIEVKLRQIAALILSYAGRKILICSVTLPSLLSRDVSLATLLFS